MSNDLELPPGYTINYIKDYNLHYALQIINSLLNYKIILVVFIIVSILLFYIFDEKNAIFAFSSWAGAVLGYISLHFDTVILTDKLLNVWIVYYQNNIIGFAVVKQYTQHSELKRLYIKSFYRNKGLGSLLVQTFLPKVIKPMYLVSVPKALNFYIRNGFVPISRHKLPNNFSQLSRMGIILAFISEDVNMLNFVKK